MSFGSKRVCLFAVGRGGFLRRGGRRGKGEEEE